MTTAEEFIAKPTIRWRMRSWLRRGIVGLTLVAVCIVVGPALALLLGLRTMVVTSGSMEPQIHAGDAVLIRARSPEEIGVGDLVAFQPAGTNTLKTHRVVAVERIGGRVFFQTQGDGNPTPDPNLIDANAIVGTVAWHIPEAGSILIHGADPRVRLVVIGLPAVVIIAREFTRLRSGGRSRRRVGTPKRPGRRMRTPARFIYTMIVVVMAITASSTAGPSATAALLSERTHVPGNDFTTAIQFGP